MAERAPLRSVFVLVLLFLAVGIAVPFLRIGGDDGVRIAGDIVYVLLALAAAFAGITSFRCYGMSSPQGRTLFFLMLAVAFDALAGIVWAVYELGLGIVNPFPSVADAVWVLFYIAAAVSLCYALWQLRRFIRPGKYVAAGGLAVLLLSLIYAFFLARIDLSGSVLQSFFAVFYPLADALLLALVFLLFITLREGAFGTSWLAFLLAFFVYTVGDLLFSHFSLLDSYLSGGVTDIAYYLTHACFFYGFMVLKRRCHK